MKKFFRKWGNLLKGIIGCIVTILIFLVCVFIAQLVPVDRQDPGLIPLMILFVSCFDAVAFLFSSCYLLNELNTMFDNWRNS